MSVTRWGPAGMRRSLSASLRTESAEIRRTSPTRMSRKSKPSNSKPATAASMRSRAASGTSASPTPRSGGSRRACELVPGEAFRIAFAQVRQHAGDVVLEHRVRRDEEDLARHRGCRGSGRKGRRCAAAAPTSCRCPRCRSTSSTGTSSWRTTWFCSFWMVAGDGLHLRRAALRERGEQERVLDGHGGVEVGVQRGLPRCRTGGAARGPRRWCARRPRRTWGRCPGCSTPRPPASASPRQGGGTTRPRRPPCRCRVPWARAPGLNCRATFAKYGCLSSSWMLSSCLGV